MSVPPPPPAFVPPPPPAAVVPPPPPSTTPTPPIAIAAVKSGGVALDMSDMFAPAAGKPKGIPPWERKSKTGSAGSTPSPPGPLPKRKAGSAGSSPAAKPLVGAQARPSASPLSLSGGSTPPPPQVTAVPIHAIVTTAAKPGMSLPSLHSDNLAGAAHSTTSPTAAGGAGEAAREPLSLAVPNSFLTTTTTQFGSPVTNTVNSLVTSQPPPAVPCPAPALAPPQPLVPPATTTTSLPALPAAVPVAVPLSTPAPAPAPAAGVAGVAPATPAPPSAAPQAVSDVPGAAPVPTAATAVVTPTPATATAPAALPLSPTTEVVVPARLLFTYNDQVQHVLVPSMPPCTPSATARQAAAAGIAHGKAKKNGPARRAAATATSTAAATGVRWRNAYDFQPSPSTHLHHTQSSSVCAQTSSTARPAGHKTAAADGWRGVYWKEVDVHRYVARRYFGLPPPVEK